MSEDYLEMMRRVKSPGAFQAWTHKRALKEESQYDLGNLYPMVLRSHEALKALTIAVQMDERDAATQAAFGVLQLLYPLVEALDSDAGKYLAQAVEKLRR
jgi:hypothetical protein